MKTMTQQTNKSDEFGFPLQQSNIASRVSKGRVVDSELDKEKPAFRVLNLDDLEQLPEPEWLVEGVIPAGCLTTLYGAPGSAKSFLALDAALCVATGTKFHGAPVKHGRVVYSLGEGIRGLRWRIEAWCIAHPTADRADIMSNFVVIPRAVHLLEEYDVSLLFNTIERQKSVDLLIIDTLARALVGGDENSAGDVGRAIAACDAVRDMTGSATMLVHHTDAAGTKARGSTALPGASDCMIRMNKDQNQNVISIINTKMKDSEPFKPVYFDLKPYGNSAALVSRQVSGGYNKPRPVEKDNPF
jgi:RecA-family ATPase